MALTLSVAFATRARRGESANGDLPILRREGEGVLFGVIDALGHGEAAEQAARAGAAFLEEVAFGTSMDHIMLGLHRSMVGTRGAAATILRFLDGTLSGAAVGNVALRAHGTRIPLLPVPGILGQRFSEARVFERKVERGDRQMIFSDGIAWQGLRLGDLSHLDLPKTVDHVIGTYGLEHDDATVLVAEVIDSDKGAFC